MSRISIDDVQAWVENSKLLPAAIDGDHLDHIETEVLARLSSVFDTSVWVDKATTPRLIQVIIAKMYAGWLYDKMYSENQSQPNIYSRLVKQNAEMLIDGILDGTIEIPGSPATNEQGPTFYPNDASSAMEPTFEDSSLGPAKFSLGRIF